MSFISFLSSVVGLQPMIAYAQDQSARESLQTAVGGTGIPQVSIPTLAANLIIIVLGIVGIIFMLLIFYAGFTWMVGGRDGNEEEIAKAKGILSAATIGLAIVICAYAITYFITSQIIAVGDQAPSAPTQQQSN